jgi:hypothetical protein
MKVSVVGSPARGVVNITSHMLDRSRAEGRDLGFGDVFRLFTLLTAYISLVLPATAWGDVYKWTDAKGITVFSDVLPKPGEKVKNFEVVAKARPETKVPAQTVTPAEQALLARVDTLERQLQARQIAAAAPAVPPPATYGSYYPPAPQPPPLPSNYYDSGYYDSGYDSGYYPSYYPSYSYPVVATYSYAYPARTYISRPVSVTPRPVSVAPHGGSFHGGGGHGGGGRGGRR